MDVLNDLLKGVSPDGAAAWSGVSLFAPRKKDLRVVELQPANDARARRTFVCVQKPKAA